MSRLLLLLTVCALLIAACGGGDDKGEATATPDSARSVQDETGCQAVADPGGQVAELSRSDNVASFRTWIVGAVVHGL